MLKFVDSCENFHSYLLVALCLFGTVGNLTNMAVLTHRRMRAPIDAIFTALAIDHLLYLLVYIPHAIATSLPQLQCVQENGSYYWTLYTVVTDNVFEVSRLIASWLTLSLVVWGTVLVAYPHRKHLLSMRRAVIVSLCAYVFCPLVCLPHILSFTVTVKVTPVFCHVDTDGDEIANLQNNGTEIYKWDYSEIGAAHDYLLVDISNWLLSVVLVLVPCVALAVVTALLMWASWRRTRSSARTALLMSALDDGGDDDEQKEEDEGFSYAPTKLLVLMSAVFLLLNVPVAILYMVEMGLNSHSKEDVTYSVGHMIFMTTFVYPAVTCWLYCATRTEFWDTLVFLVKPKCLRRRGADVGGSTATQLTVA